MCSACHDDWITENAIHYDEEPDETPLRIH